MARARRLRKNPSIPRLEWVRKNYPQWVWAQTVISFLLAVGLDDYEQVFDNSFAGYLDELSLANAGNEGWDGYPAKSLFDNIADDVGKQLRLDGLENTEYDRYIPWLANRINAIGKKPSKKLRKELEKVFPDMILPRKGSNPARKIDVNPYTYAKDATLVFTRQDVRRMPFDKAEGIIYAYEGIGAAWGEIYELRNTFGSIVRWAEDRGVNLDDYSAREAIDAAKEWARTKPKLANVVAGDIVYEFDDGWTFQELKTKPQLKCEGMYLDHCVKSYKPRNIGVIYRIYSLRDPEGRPVATLEWGVEGEYVRQFKTTANEWPDKDAVQRAIEFRRKYLDEKLVTVELDLTDLFGPNATPRNGAMDWKEWYSYPPGSNIMPAHARVSQDELVRQVESYGIDPPWPMTNPRKHKRKAPESKRLIDRCHKLWESYDAKPLKRNLVAFGKHIEIMKKSDSAKVKTEAQRAARAFNKEFKARGWKR